MLTEYMDWYRRARGKISLTELCWLLPPGVMYGASRLMAARLLRLPKPPVDKLPIHDRALSELLFELFRLIGRDYFRLKLEGMEHIPSQGAAMLVGNHNGGIMPIDTLFTLLAVRDHCGPGRLVHPLAHDVLFAHPLLRRYGSALGVLRAGRASSEQIIDAQRLILVYPGSDYDAGRSFWNRHKIVLGQRTGFLEVALRRQVPIVPVVSVGTHEQLVILTDGQALAKRIGMHRLTRTNIFPLALMLPWGLAPALFPYLPLPAQTTVRFGAPIAFPDVSPEQASDPEVLRRCYLRVESAMQQMLDELSDGRIPIIGQRSAKKKPATQGDRPFS